MKASELAVGDWVMPLRKSIGKPCQVVSIDCGTNTCWIDSDEYSGLLPCNELERIPLTPEILEKNGFKKEENAGYVWDDYRGIIVAYCTFTKRLRIIKDLNILFDTQDYADVYVHTLQHALCLCGIDKEIVI